MSPLRFSRRQFLKTAGLAGSAWYLAGRAPAVAGPVSKRKPNIVYVFADQLRADIPGCYGGSQVGTPNMDLLAQQGVRMTNCISSYPVCSPYRAMMLSGRYPMRNGTVGNNVALKDGLSTIGSVCKANGYATGYVGKWHLENYPTPFVPPERRHGFSDYWASRNCAHVYFDSFYCADTPEHIPLPGWEPEGQTNLALDFMRRHKDRPFCLVLSWGPPHDPYIAPPEYLARYPVENIRLPENLNDRKTVDALLAADATADAKVQERRAKYRASLDSDDKLKRWWQGYMGSTRTLDDQLGRIQRELETLGIADDTIFVFTSDHGDMLGSHRMGSKQSPFEESLRVPFLLRYPRGGVLAGSQSDALLSPVDIKPTLLSLAGLEVPSGLDGRDYTGALRGSRHDQRDDVLLMKLLPGGVPYFMNGIKEWRGVRTKQYTYTRQMTGPWLLFDNLKDPHQTNNLIADAGLKGVRDGMESRLAVLMQEAGDPGVTAEIRKMVNKPPKPAGETEGDAG